MERSTFAGPEALSQLAILLGADAPGPRAGFLHRRGGTDQHAPYLGIYAPQGKRGGAVACFHFSAQPLRVGMTLKRADLYGVISWSGRGRSLQDLNAHSCGTWTHEIDGARRGVRQIDDAVIHKRTAIVDANVHRFVVFQIDDTHESAKR